MRIIYRGKNDSNKDYSDMTTTTKRKRERKTAIKGIK